jgi:hypothetical protein
LDLHEDVLWRSVAKSWPGFIHDGPPRILYVDCRVYRHQNEEFKTLWRVIGQVRESPLHDLYGFLFSAPFILVAKI